MFEGIVSGFLGFFNGMVSVYVSEINIVEFYVLRPFQRYIICYHFYLKFFIDTPCLRV